MNDLDVIADQVRTTCTGAVWQLNAVRALRRGAKQGIKRSQRTDAYGIPVVTGTCPGRRP
ncbi:hypothetical protein ACH4SK_40120 [Streptomyces inhibens]|uniref:hypothetical protein n=1 Tax=Streptomyces inhibens TaxID=2293571 RepID=UPI0037BB706F